MAPWIGTSLMARTLSPARMPALAAGEFGEMCQARTPEEVSSQDTPSSGVEKIARCWKLMTPNTIAAKVARARTAAPNRILKLSFIEAPNGVPCELQLNQNVATLLPKYVNRVKTRLHLKKVLTRGYR